jgi:transposase
MVQRRLFSPEFKTEAVRLVKERGVTQLQASKDLGIHISVLRRWIRQTKAPAPPAPAAADLPEQAELIRLRRENAQLKAERDLLKKAAAYFAKDQL